MRTDNPEAEIGLFEDEKKLGYVKWNADRQLSETIHEKIRDLLKSQNKEIHDINGIVFFKGPGSFTGLRIGISVANALAYSLSVPIIASKSDEWISNGLTALLARENDKVALPEYGSPPHITLPKH